MKKIKQITVLDDHGAEQYFIVGKYGCELITEHKSQGEGDRWYYDVQLEKQVIRLFNFESVIFERE